MTANRRLPRCPHCGRQLAFWEAFTIHTHGEYDCPRCAKASDIIYHRNIYQLAVFTTAAGVILLLGVYFIFQGKSPWGVLPVIAPFLLFTLFCSRLMRLVPILPAGQKARAKKKQSRPAVPPAHPTQKAPLAHTQEIPRKETVLYTEPDRAFIPPQKRVERQMREVPPPRPVRRISPEETAGSRIGVVPPPAEKPIPPKKRSARHETNVPESPGEKELDAILQEFLNRNKK